MVEKVRPIGEKTYNELTQELEALRIEANHVLYSAQKAVNEVHLRGILEQFDFLNEKICSISEILTTSYVVLENVDTDCVKLGDFVTLRVTFMGEEFVEYYYIAETSEGDLMTLSQNSLLGQAVIGKKIGDIIEYKKNNDIFKVEILSKEVVEELKR